MPLARGTGSLKRVSGYRARSALKLQVLDDEYELLTTAKRVVDLCAAPGSWCQVARERAPAATVVAVDLQNIAPIAGVRVLRGDITTDETADAVVAGLGGERADLVLCDGAAEVTGLHDLDEHLHSQLLGAATRLSRRVLAPGGAFLAKIFRSRDGPDLLRSQLRVLFRHVDVAKPASSRDRSGEAFVICRGYVPLAAPARDAALLEPYLAIGDLSGYDDAPDQDLTTCDDDAIR